MLCVQSQKSVHPSLERFLAVKKFCSQVEMHEYFLSVSNVFDKAWSGNCFITLYSSFHYAATSAKINNRQSRPHALKQIWSFSWNDRTKHSTWYCYRHDMSKVKKWNVLKHCSVTSEWFCCKEVLISSGNTRVLPQYFQLHIQIWINCLIQVAASSATGIF